MRVFVVGGSGRTGKLVIDELLNRNHKVTALVRDPASLEPTRDGLLVIKGTPTSREDVRRAFEAVPGNIPEVAIVTMSAPRASDSPFAAVVSPPRLMADCNANVAAVLRENASVGPASVVVGGGASSSSSSTTPNPKIGKLVVLQAFGVGASWPNMHSILRFLMSKSNMSYQYEDHDHVDRELRATEGLRFVMVRPSRLAEGPVRPVREWPGDGKGLPLMASCTRSSVAQWLVSAAEQDTWDDTAPVISN